MPLPELNTAPLEERHRWYQNPFRRAYLDGCVMTSAKAINDVRITVHKRVGELEAFILIVDGPESEILLAHYKEFIGYAVLEDGQIETVYQAENCLIVHVHEGGFADGFVGGLTNRVHAYTEGNPFD